MSVLDDLERAVIAGLILVLLVSTMIWMVGWYRAAGDPSRCPDHGPLRATAVDRGGWGQQDTCLYEFVETGEAAYPDTNVAGARPASTSYPVTLAWVTAAALPLSAAYVWRRAAGRRARQPESADHHERPEVGAPT